MNEFIVRIISGVLGAIAAVIVTRFWKDWQQRKGELTGEWIQFVYNEKGEAEKKDRIILKHNHFTKKVEGKIERLTPKDQHFKKWVFNGVVRGNILFVIFWSADLEKNPGSYGTIQLHEINEGKLSGFYIRPNPVATNTGLINEFQKTRLKWQRETKHA